jgi:hypothetical protein
VVLTRGPQTVALVVILALYVTPAQGQSDWKQFTHPDLGFSVNYPPGWVPRIVNDPDDLQLRLVLIGPPAARVPPVELAVSVSTNLTSPTETAEDLFAEIFGDVSKPVGNARVLRVDRTRLSGIPAIIVYATSITKSTPYATSYPRGSAIYVMVLLVAAKSRAYVVSTITALDSTQLAAEIQLLQAILGSFRPSAGSLTGSLPY